MSFNKKNYTGTDKKLQSNEMQHAFHLFIGLLSLIVWPCVLTVITAAWMHLNDPYDIVTYYPYTLWTIMLFTYVFAIGTYILVRVQDLEITFTQYAKDLGVHSIVGYTLALILLLAIGFGFCYQKQQQLDAVFKMQISNYKDSYVNSLGSVTYVADVIVATTDSILFIQTKYDNKLDSITNETHQTWGVGNFFHFYGYKPGHVPDKIYNWDNRNCKEKE